MTYPARTIVRRLACGVCPRCEGAGKPVAARSGVTHEHANLLCVEHLLEALGMPVQPPRSPTDPPDPAAIRSAFRATLQAEEPGGPDPSPTAATHARQAPPTHLEPEALAAALECMRQLGAVPLRSEPTYGIAVGWGCDWRPPKPAALPHVYDPGKSVDWRMSWSYDDPGPVGLPGLEVPLDDEAVPSGARTLGRSALKTAWTVRVMAGPETVILRCERAGVLVLARYELGGGSTFRLAAAWLRAGRGEPAPCTAKQLAAILKVSA